MLFDDNDFNYEISLFKIPGSDFNIETRASKFLTPEEGLMKGNLEKDTFIPYNQYTYFKLIAENEKEQMEIKLMAYAFALTDLNLYLDLHPEDQTTYELFKKYAKEKKELEQTYNQKYGPLEVCDTNKTNFDWPKNPWPWDNEGGSTYV